MKSTVLALLAFIGTAGILSSASTARRPYLDAALETAKWLEGTAVRTERGVTWPAVPGDAASVASNLYSGSAGVALFFMEAHKATGERKYLNQARAAVNHLAATYETIEDSGLYTGLAGVCYAIAEAHRLTGDRTYLSAARGCTARLRDRAKRVGAGLEWSETTDIIGGGAGIGLYLLYAARSFDGAESRDAAILAGRRLMSLARTDSTGSSWRMNPTFPRVMPNFSHGTAGIAYFLATLYGETAAERVPEGGRRGRKAPPGDRTHDG